MMRIFGKINHNRDRLHHMMITDDDKRFEEHIKTMNSIRKIKMIEAKDKQLLNKLDRDYKVGLDER